MDQNRMLKPALIGGFLLGILSAVPPVNFLNCACCAWGIGGGALAAYLWVQASPVVVTLGNGFLLGLITGAIGGAVTTIFSIPVQILMRNLLAQYAAEINQTLGQMANLPPWFRELMQNAQTAEITPSGLIFALFINVLMFGLFGMLGGTLGVALFEKRNAQPPRPPYAPQPPLQIPPDPPPPQDTGPEDFR